MDRPGVMPAFEPALFRLISSTSGQQRYILVEESQIMIIPGSSHLRIHVFDTHGVLLNAQEYSMYRTTLKRVHFRKVAAMNHEVLMVETMYCLGGNKASEFYALVGNQLRPVYLEGESGFEASADPQVQRSVEDWEESLRSHDEGEVMSALMWLGANRRTTYIEHEEQKASTLLSRNGVLQRLRELSRSENQWKKTAARYILRTL